MNSERLCWSTCVRTAQGALVVPPQKVSDANLVTQLRCDPDQLNGVLASS